MPARLLSVLELCEELGIDRRTLYHLRGGGRAPRAIKVGRELRFRRSDVDAWLEANTEPTADRSAS